MGVQNILLLILIMPQWQAILLVHPACLKNKPYSFFPLSTFILNFSHFGLLIMINLRCCQHVLLQLISSLYSNLQIYIYFYVFTCMSFKSQFQLGVKTFYLPTFFDTVKIKVIEYLFSFLYEKHPFLNAMHETGNIVIGSAKSRIVYLFLPESWMLGV